MLNTHIFLALFLLCLVSDLAGQDAVPVNLGKLVNSSASELLPIISPDGNTLYFVREGHPQNYGYKVRSTDQDIWYSTVSKDGSWSAARNLGSPLNNSASNAITGITSDGMRALVLGYYDEEEGLIGRGYSFSVLGKNGWRKPVGIDISGYDDLCIGTKVSACLSENGKTIVFSLSESEDDSNHELFVTHHVGGSEWSLPIRLSDINTDDTEACPFLASDGVTLYFSSDRNGGYGDLDLYVSRRLDDSWERWSDPVNLGPIINSRGSDKYYTIPSSGLYAYYSSTAGNDNEDIYKIELPESVRPRPVVLIKGRIFDSKTKKPIETEVQYETLNDGKVVGSTTSNPLTGEYQIVLPSGKAYGYYARAEGMYPISEHLDLTALKEYKEIRRDLYLTRIEVGATIRMNNIFFDFNKAELREESIPELDRLIAVLRGSPSMTIQINGHTDNVGTQEYNQQLSEQRAEAVRSYLLSTGNIAASRLKSRGYGFSMPVASNNDDAGRQMNRRVEFNILSQ